MITRIAKKIANSGICSRREAERLISSGLVKINGEIIKTPICEITDNSVILIKDKPIPKNITTSLWIYNKPPGFITTHNDPEGRPTIFSTLPKSLPHIISVGRLDINSEGLLLLTNNGKLARFLELPSSQLVRCYKVRVFGEIPKNFTKILEKGITIKENKYKPIKVTINSDLKKKNNWITLKLKEGKNREIRKIMQYFNLKISRLIRISYGPFLLKNLKSKEIKKITHSEYLKKFNLL